MIVSFFRLRLPIMGHVREDELWFFCFWSIDTSTGLGVSYGCCECW